MNDKKDPCCGDQEGQNISEKCLRSGNLQVQPAKRLVWLEGRDQGRVALKGVPGREVNGEAGPR